MKEKAEKRETKSRYSTLVPAVDEASRILICLAESIPFKMSLTDICKKTGIHKSKGYSILNTLQKYGFIYKNPSDKTYSLGPGLISLSRKVLDNLDYKEIVSPFLEDLALTTQCSAFFGVINGDNLFVVAKHDAGKKIGVTIRLGHRFSLTAGAHGKAIVAFLPEEKRAEILKKDRLFFHGDASKIDRERLQIELNQCMKNGFAVDIGELSPGINAIASPVFNSQGDIIGSIFLVGTFHISNVNIFGENVFRCAYSISKTLGADVDMGFHTVLKKINEGGSRD